jgi:hypothetical protein
VTAETGNTGGWNGDEAAFVTAMAPLVHGLGHKGGDRLSGEEDAHIPSVVGSTDGPPPAAHSIAYALFFCITVWSPLFIHSTRQCQGEMGHLVAQKRLVDMSRILWPSLLLVR